jgi:hypothetical protein
MTWRRALHALLAVLGVFFLVQGIQEGRWLGLFLVVALSWGVLGAEVRTAKRRL